MTPVVGSAQQAPCSGGELNVEVDSPLQVGGIVCPDLTDDFTLNLADGVTIAGDSGPGLLLEGSGSFVVNGSGSSVAGAEGENAVTIATDGDVTLQLNDLSSTGHGTFAIDVSHELATDSRSIDLEVQGTISLDALEEEETGGISVSYSGWSGETVGTSTSVLVNEIMSTSAGSTSLNARSPAILIEMPGQIDVTSGGSISTKGHNAPGIEILQYSSADATTPKISVSIDDLSTSGDYSEGMVVASFATGTPIDVEVIGAVETTGRESHGILLDAGLGVGMISIREGGSLSSTGTEALAIFSEPIDPAFDPMEVVTVENRGVVSGSVRSVSNCAPRFLNHGLFESGSSVELLTGGPCGMDEYSQVRRGQIWNEGTLSPGGTGSIATTDVAGDLLQTSSGVLEFDVDWQQQVADTIDATGSIELAGEVSVNSLTRLPESGSVTIMTAAEIVGEESVDLADTLLVNYSLMEHAPADNDSVALRLGVDLDLDHDSLNQNQRNVLRELFDSRDASDTIDATFEDILTIHEADHLRPLLDGLGNEIAGAAMNDGVGIFLRTAGNVPSCSTTDAEFPRRDRCAWGTSQLASREQADSWPQRGYQADAHGSQVGGSIGFDDANLNAGVFIGYTSSDVTIQDLASAEGQVFHSGITFAGGMNSLGFSLMAGMDWGTYDIRRHGTALTSSGSMRTTISGVGGKIWYGLVAGPVTIAPNLGLGIANYESKAYSESGAGELSLDVSGLSGKSRYESVGVDFKFSLGSNHETQFSPTLGIGYNRFSDESIHVDSAFSGGTGSFLTTIKPLPSAFEARLGTEFESRSGRFSGSVALVAASGQDEDANRYGVNAELEYRF